MRLLVDLSSLIAPNTARRGIGFYATHLTRALCRDARDHEVHLLVVGTLDVRAVMEVREAFDGLVPHERVHVLEPIRTPSLARGDRVVAAQVNEALRESTIAALAPDAVLVTSLFELDPDRPTSVGRWLPGPLTAVVLYDLMPLEEPQLLGDPAARVRYMRKLEDLRRADLLLAISEYTRERAMSLLDDDCPPVTAVFGAAIPNLGTRAGGPPARLAGRSFVLCVGGDHPRKNMDGLVRAWARLPRALRRERALVLACEISSTTTRRLREVAAEEGLLPDDVVLTGFVSTANLAWLYDGADVFVLPSFAEGLGLPALEAMERGCPVLVADSTSLRELVPLADARFDPGDPNEIARAIERALTDPDLMAALRRQSEQQAASFTWERSASLAWAALEESLARRARDAPADAAQASRPTLAIVSPWPPVRSGVADYALRTAAALATCYDVTLVGDAPTGCGLPRVSRERFVATWGRYDRVLYHFGNSPAHTDDMALLPRAPGAVLLHDCSLAGTLRYADEPLGHPGGVQALLEEGGAGSHDGTTTSDQRGLRSVLSGAIGVQVHSEHAASEVARSGFSQAPVAVVPHPVLEPDGPPGVGRAGELTRIVGHFGFVQAFKQPELLLQAVGLAAARLRLPVEVVFIGAVAHESYEAELERLAASFGVPVRFLGYVPPDVLAHWTSTVDCAVQLRSVSHGESSGSVARLLAAGRPTVVSDIGSFSELPRDVVRHHPRGAGPEVLAEALVECLTPATGDALGRRAAAYADEVLSLRSWVEGTRDALETAYATSVAVQGASALRRASHQGSADLRDRLFRALAATSVRRRTRSGSVWASDISVLSVTPFLSGIQRVTLSLHRELAPLLARRGAALVAADVAPATVRRQPHRSIREDAVVSGVQVHSDECDWLLCLDLDFELPHVEGLLQQARARGTRVLVNVFDLLIVSNPEWFVPYAADSVFLPWLSTAVRVADLITVNSRTTERALRAWVLRRAPERAERLRVHVLPLGVDVPDQPTELRPRGDVPHFAVVGTIEPRKGHDDLLDAFDLLWARGIDVRLSIVGRQGWLVEPLVARLSAHPERGRRLEWLSSADDAVLESVLQRSDAVVVPSRGEGFGLPVVEAAVRQLPVVVRDIPVLREVAGDGATYFRGGGHELADVLADWVTRWHAGLPPAPGAVRLHSWSEVAARLVDLLEQDSAARAPVPHPDQRRCTEG